MILNIIVINVNNDDEEFIVANYLTSKDSFKTKWKRC